MATKEKLSEDERLVLLLMYVELHGFDGSVRDIEEFVGKLGWNNARLRDARRSLKAKGLIDHTPPPRGVG